MKRRGFIGAIIGGAASLFGMRSGPKYMIGVDPAAPALEETAVTTWRQGGFTDPTNAELERNLTRWVRMCRRQRPWDNRPLVLCTESNYEETKDTLSKFYPNADIVKEQKL